MHSEIERGVLVRYYAAARELAGVAEERVELTLPCSAAELMTVLAARHPALASVLSRMRVAIGDEISSPDAQVCAGAEVSVIPPVAGGHVPPAVEGLCAIRSEQLSIDEVVAAVSGPSVGGIAIFVGTVRDHAEGKPVARLDYEAHPTLALAELIKIVHEARAHHEGVKLAIVHRIGALAVGELAVVIAASAPHRAEAFAACREAIEQIKQRVPIWKKELAPDGTAYWVNLGCG